jgi:hypothetical protein
MEGKISKSSVLSVGFMKFKVSDEAYIWFIGFGKRTHRNIVQDFF